jgi:hypothetical protein
MWTRGYGVYEGEREAWDLLDRVDPADVGTRAEVPFDPSSGSYVLTSLGQDVRISLQTRDILGGSPAGEFLVKDLGHLSRVSILFYLIYAKDLPVSGRLVKPALLPGGEIYVRGAHALPLHRIAEEFAEDPERFLDKGNRLGGLESEHGDVSLTLFPFPKLPVLLALWRQDDEFPSGCTLLFDSTCELHFPSDVLWATAMMTVQMMLAQGL